MFDEPYTRVGGGLWKRFVGAVVAIIVLAAIATATAGLLQVNNVVKALNQTPSLHLSSAEITPSEAGAPQTFLIIGSDKRAQSSAVQDRLSPPRSDTLMLVRMDPHEGQTSILSIPRDLQVTIVPRNGLASTQKVNAAYGLGGARLTLDTIKRLLGPRVRINHIIDVNFRGFRRVVDAIGCVYVYVDRHYLNHNSGTIASNFSSIDIQPGYQRLCDQRALDYARYRHTDSDFVRVARQQDFIRQAKDQVGVLGLLDNRDAIEQAFGRAVQTDSGLHHTAEILRVLKLAAFSLGKPIRQVPFQSTAGPSFVNATPYDIERTVNDFLGGAAAPKPSPPVSHPARRGRHASRAQVPGLGPTPRADLDAARTASAGFALPIYAPRVRVQSTSEPDIVRDYRIRDERNHVHRAYVISISRGIVGQYYGVEGMDWINPPILTHPSETRTVDGRKFELYFNGVHLRLVAWRTPRAVYWLNNTLTSDLSTGQLLAIAASATPVH